MAVTDDKPETRTAPPARRGRAVLAIAGYQREALRRGWPTVVVVDETPAETSPAALARVLAG